MVLTVMFHFSIPVNGFQPIHALIRPNMGGIFQQGEPAPPIVSTFHGAGPPFKFVTAKEPSSTFTLIAPPSNTMATFRQW